MISKQTAPYIPRIVVLGDQCVGKTSLVKHLVHGEFDEEREPTIALESYNYVNSDFTREVEITDTTGDKRLHALVTSFCHNIDGAIIVYDITSQKTFHNAKWWYQKLREVDSFDDNVAICLVGNKTDVAKDRRVDFKRAGYFALDHRLIFHEVSAKSGDGVAAMFEHFLNFLPDEDSIYIQRRQLTQFVKKNCCEDISCYIM